MVRRPAPPPVLPFTRASPSAGPRVEVQRLDTTHPLGAMALHAHEFFELIWIERGQTTHVIGVVAHRARAGDVFALPPGVPHRFDGLQNAVGRLVLFEHDALDSDTPVGPLHALASPLTRSFFTPAPQTRLDSQGLRRFNALAAQLSAEVDREDGWRTVTVVARLRLMLAELDRQVGHAAAPERRPQLLDDVFTVIEDGFRAPLSTSQVAAAMHRNANHLTSVVKTASGRTIGDWIQERRMIEARHLLRTTDLSISAVASACGFGDARHFMRRFRTRHSMTAGQWRSAERSPEDHPQVGEPGPS